MKTVFEPIFNVYLEEGKELSYSDLLLKCPKELKTIKRKYPRLTVKKIMRMIRKVYYDRWHEIQPKPSVASASILDKMRIAARK